MSMKESVARLAASRAPVEFFWWKWEDAKHFLGAALDAGPGSSFRAYPGIGADGRPDVHFVIHMPDGKIKASLASTTADDEVGFDFVHTCPPDCPK